VRLELYIRGHLLDAVEFFPPAYEKFLGFESNEEMRESYVKEMIKSLKKNNKAALENQEWEIFLIVPIQIFEPELN